MTSQANALPPLEEIEFQAPRDPSEPSKGLHRLLWNILRVNWAVWRSPPRRDAEDGEVEILHDTEMTHRFVSAPADGDTIVWHYVEAGKARSGQPSLVFLHGMPESWYMWHHQIAAFAPDWHCIAPDLRGYGQSDKSPGDYRQEGVADQMHDLLAQIGVEKAVFITHDRGSVIADYLIANYPEMAAGYVRGEQHLVHFNPCLAPQEKFFLDPKQSRKLAWAWLVIPFTFVAQTHHPIPLADQVRARKEFSYPGIAHAVLRYFYSSSFVKEWRDRRHRLIKAWKCPILVLQGEHDTRQPKANYLGIEGYFEDMSVEFIDGGHFYVTENPTATTQAIERFLHSRI